VGKAQLPLEKRQIKSFGQKEEKAIFDSKKRNKNKKHFSIFFRN
jgi:hypothetical protein